MNSTDLPLYLAIHDKDFFQLSHVKKLAIVKQWLKETSLEDVSKVFHLCVMEIISPDKDLGKIRVSLLLEGNTGEQQFDVNGVIYSTTGETALHIAIRDGWVSGVSRLLDCGASADIENDCKILPLYLAIHSSRIQIGDPIVKRLMQKTSQANLSKVFRLCVQGVVANDYQLLREYEVEFLLEENAKLPAGQKFDVNTVIDPCTGETVLHIAIKNSWSERGIRCLLDHGADVNIKDNNGKTPVALAWANSRADLQLRITELLESKVKAEQMAAASENKGGMELKEIDRSKVEHENDDTSVNLTSNSSAPDTKRVSSSLYFRPRPIKEEFAPTNDGCGNPFPLQLTNDKTW